MKRIVFVAVLTVLAVNLGQLHAQTVADADKYANILKSDKNADKRLRAAKELGTLADIKVAFVRPHAGILIDAFKGDADPQVRIAAGQALILAGADAKEVAPAVLEVVGNDKQSGHVLAVAAQVAAAYQIKDAIPALQSLQKREEDKDDPKERDQRLVKALTQSLRALAK
jgi:hypothetical protein